MRTVAVATLFAIAVASPGIAQTRDDLRGPTGQQRVKLPPGVKGATGGGQTGARCRVVVRHHHRMRTCPPARG